MPVSRVVVVVLNKLQDKVALGILTLGERASEIRLALFNERVARPPSHPPCGCSSARHLEHAKARKSREGLGWLTGGFVERGPIGRSLGTLSQAYLNTPLVSHSWGSGSISRLGHVRMTAARPGILADLIEVVGARKRKNILLRHLLQLSCHPASSFMFKHLLSWDRHCNCFALQLEAVG